MDFMRLLKSVEELLYELVSWLLFYPLTLWRCIRQPLQMMRYAETELGDKVEDQFDDALSPPILLLLTLFITHLVQLKFGTNNAAVGGLLSDETNLLLFRAVAFSIFPLLFAWVALRIRGARLTRKTLRAAFYSQCYAAAPFALAVNLTTTLGSNTSAWEGLVGALIFVLSLSWYTTSEVRWFVKYQGQSVGKAVAIVAMTTAACLVLFGIVLVATALTIATP